jgi:hypothetical protein
MPQETEQLAPEIVELIAACREAIDITSIAAVELIEACTSASVGRCLMETLNLSDACTATEAVCLSPTGSVPFVTRSIIADCQSTSASCASACERILGTVASGLDLAAAARRCESACARALELTLG